MAASHSDILLAKLQNKSAVIGVIGLGYVGLPLSMAALAGGVSVVGFDIDPTKIEALHQGDSYLKHLNCQPIFDAINDKRFEATTDFTRLSEPDVLVICVPTPLTRYKDPDLSYLVRTVDAIARELRPGQLIILESTTYPGTTREVMRPLLEASQLKTDSDYFLAYSPEREDPGNPTYSTATIPKVVGGDTPEARQLAEAFYQLVTEDIVMVSSTNTAEMVKLSENIFRAVNIALVNEMKVICDAMGIDIWEVIDAAKTKPFGYMPFYPGPGLGGHCIPIDPFYLTWKAKEFDITTRFIELAGEINANMPLWVVDRLAQAVDQRLGKGVSRSKILIVGIAYKKNVDDMRESPALRIMDLLHERGSEVDYFDPLVPEIPPTREHAALTGLKSQVWTEKLAASYDAAVIVTDHDGVDYAALAQAANIVVDTRNACRKHGVRSDNIVPA